MEQLSTKVVLVLFCLVLFVALGESQRGVTSPPYFGIYHGPAPFSPANYAAYEAWIGRPVVFATDFEAIDDWNQLEGQSWLLNPWSKYMNTPSAYPRYFVLSVGMLPVNSPNSLLINGSNGQYNSSFRTLAQNLVNYNLSSAYIRIGWEFNGNWQPWRVGSYPAQWTKYWQIIVEQMRSVPGGNFKFIWNVNAGYAETDAWTVWPGVNYVDVVGIDSYDVDYSQYNNAGLKERGTYSASVGYNPNDLVDYQGAWYKSLANQTNVTPSLSSSSWLLTTNSTSLAAKRAVTWQNLYSGHLGLLFWANFSRAVGKPIALCEWGVWLQERGGGDNPSYIRQMYDFLMNSTNNVLYYSYFDVYAYDGDHGLGPGASGSLPLSAAEYKRLFTLNMTMVSPSLTSSRSLSRSISDSPSRGASLSGSPSRGVSGSMSISLSTAPSPASSTSSSDDSSTSVSEESSSGSVYIPATGSTTTLVSWASLLLST